MKTTRKSAVPFAGRLVRESLKLGWRVAGVIGGVVAGALWNAAKEAPALALRNPAPPSGANSIGSYWEAQEAFDAGRINAAEMAYYRSAYDVDDV